MDFCVEPSPENTIIARLERPKAAKDEVTARVQCSCAKCETVQSAKLCKVHNYMYDICSVTNSSYGLNFVKIWAHFLQKYERKYRLNSSFCNVFFLVHAQSVIDLFAKQLNKALNLH